MRSLSYVCKDEMYQMALTIERKLPGVLDLTFSQGDKQEVSFRQCLEESILTRVAEVKEAIEKF